MAKSKKPRKSSPAPKVPDQKQHSVTAIHRVQAGPLPPPEVLMQYNQAVPDSAERIIVMAEAQSKHRQELESKVIESDINNSKLGLHYGLIIGLAAVIGGTICILYGHEVGGSIIGGTGLTGLVGVFVYGSRSRRKEREQRFKAETDANNPL